MPMKDEPTSALDPRAEHLAISRFKQLAAGNAAVFVTGCRGFWNEIRR
ncbi:MAG: ABC transporter ATP-binding protein [Pseudonocardiaceae bacterium]